MQIWFDTTQTDSPSFVGPDCDGGDCLPDSRVLSKLRLFSTSSQMTEDTIQHVSTLLLQQTIPLHIQKCAPGRWLACNPTGSGRIVVLDTEAKLLLEQFRISRLASEVLPLVANIPPERVARAVTFFYSVGLLQDSATSPMASEQEETDTLTAWLHVTNACNLRCQYCYLEHTSETMP